MQNMSNILAGLPSSVDEHRNALKTIFVGAHIPNREHLRKACGVTRHKLRNVLAWLKRHYHMYRTIPSKIPSKTIFG